MRFSLVLNYPRVKRNNGYLKMLVDGGLLLDVGDNYHLEGVQSERNEHHFELDVVGLDLGQKEEQYEKGETSHCNYVGSDCLLGLELEQSGTSGENSFFLVEIGRAEGTCREVRVVTGWVPEMRLGVKVAGL